MAAYLKNVKLFRFLRQYYLAIGIHPAGSNHNCRFDSKCWLQLLALTQFSITSTAVVFIDAEPIIEVGEGFYVASTVLGTIIFFLLQMWKIDDIEGFITKRKLST